MFRESHGHVMTFPYFRDISVCGIKDDRGTVNGTCTLSDIVPPFFEALSLIVLLKNEF